MKYNWGKSKEKEEPAKPETKSLVPKLPEFLKKLSELVIKPKSEPASIIKPKLESKPFTPPLEPIKPLVSKPSTTFVPPKITPPALINCNFVGQVQKAPQFGNAFFEAQSKPHQKHSNNFTCLDVISHEYLHSRHAENCPHVGYWTATKCGCRNRK